MKKGCLALLNYRKPNPKIEKKQPANFILCSNIHNNASKSVNYNFDSLFNFSNEQEIEEAESLPLDLSNNTNKTVQEPKSKRERRDSIFNAFAFLRKESITNEEKVKKKPKTNAKHHEEICVIGSYTKLKLFEQFINNEIINPIPHKPSSKAKSKQIQNLDNFYIQTLIVYQNFIHTSQSFKSQSLSSPITTATLTQFFWSSTEFLMENEDFKEYENLSIKDMKVLAKKFKDMLKKFESSIANQALQKSRERRDTI